MLLESRLNTEAATTINCRPWSKGRVVKLWSHKSYPLDHHDVEQVDYCLVLMLWNWLLIWYLLPCPHTCHGAAVGRLGRLHDYPFWMFPFLCLD